MDSLAALALATEAPTPSLLERKPVGRDAPLITRKMWRFIVVHSIYQIIVNFVLLYAGDKIFGHRFKLHSREHYTLIFNTFVFMQLFNEINARRLEDEIDVFSGILKNRFFVGILIATAIVQAIFVEFGGDFTSTKKLIYWEWFICIGLGALELPVGVLVRLIPVENIETRKSLEDMELESIPTLKDTVRDSNPAVNVPLMHSHAYGDGGDAYRAGPALARPPARSLKRRWSLVRMAVRQIGVLSAFKAMKTYRTVHGIEM
jgi:hypothetical protein